MNSARLSISAAFIAFFTAACDDAPTTTSPVATDPSLASLATECQTRCPPPPRIVYTRVIPGLLGSPENREIYSMKEDGTDKKRLTFSLGPDGEPTWSPDRLRIAFVSSRTGSSKLYTMNADGTDVKQVTFGTGNDTHPSWSPDGKALVFMSDRTPNLSMQIYTVNVDGTQLTRVTKDAFDYRDPVWSKTGSAIYASSTRDGTGYWHLYVMNTSGNGIKRLTSGNADDFDLNLSSDGAKLIFLRILPSMQNQIVELATMTGVDLGFSLWYQNPQVQLSSPSYSPDGEWFAYTKYNGPGSELEIWKQRMKQLGSAQLTGSFESNLQSRWSR